MVRLGEPVRRAPALLDAWSPDDGFLLEREGAGVAGRGIGAAAVVPPGPGQRTEAPEAAAALLREAGDEAAVVVGALPFDAAVPARLWVPGRVLRTPDGVLPDLDAPSGGAVPGEGPPPVVRPSGAGEAAGRDGIVARPEPPPGMYAAAVAEAVERIGRGELRKVVLARTLLLDLPWSPTPRWSSASSMAATPAATPSRSAAPPGGCSSAPRRRRSSAAPGGRSSAGRWPGPRRARPTRSRTPPPPSG